MLIYFHHILFWKTFHRVASLLLGSQNIAVFSKVGNCHSKSQDSVETANIDSFVSYFELW